MKDFTPVTAFQSYGQPLGKARWTEETLAKRHRELCRSEGHRPKLPTWPTSRNQWPDSMTESERRIIGDHTRGVSIAKIAARRGITQWRVRQAIEEHAKKKGEHA